MQRLRLHHSGFLLQTTTTTFSFSMTSDQINRDNQYEDLKRVFSANFLRIIWRENFTHDMRISFCRFHKKITFLINKKEMQRIGEMESYLPLFKLLGQLNLLLDRFHQLWVDMHDFYPRFGQFYLYHVLSGHSCISQFECPLYDLILREVLTVERLLHVISLFFGWLEFHIQNCDLFC